MRSQTHLLKIVSKLLLSGLLLAALSLHAQKKDKKLERQLVSLLQGFHGQAGVYVKNLRTGRTAAVGADTLFPTASMVKIPILLGVMNKIESGELSFHQQMIYRDSLLYPGVDLLGSFKTGEKIELSKLLMLMLTMSDNTASLWLQSLAGGGSRINQLLDSLGLVHTRVNSRTPGREDNRSLYGWGQSTPAEMAGLLEKIYQGDVFFKKHSTEEMLRLLGRDYWDEEAISQIPPFVFVASKNGAVDHSRSETILAMAPHGPYIFSIMTKGLTDSSWDPTNEGWVLARKLSRLLWNYYEPRSGWEPSQPVDGKL
jgi:beta-lactamase class A